MPQPRISDRICKWLAKWNSSQEICHDLVTQPLEHLKIAEKRPSVETDAVPRSRITRLKSILFLQERLWHKALSKFS